MKRYRTFQEVPNFLTMLLAIGTVAYVTWNMFADQYNNDLWANIENVILVIFITISVVLLYLRYLSMRNDMKKKSTSKRIKTTENSQVDNPETINPHQEVNFIEHQTDFIEVGSIIADKEKEKAQ